MHLLVLSAFQHTLKVTPVGAAAMFQCTFWCSVLSNVDGTSESIAKAGFQCTFWCSVLSNKIFKVLEESIWEGFNAPSGAQCFPTP